MPSSNKLFAPCFFAFCVLSALPAQVDPVIGEAITFADAQMRRTLAGIGYGEEGNNPDWITFSPDFPKVTTSDSGETEWGFQSRTSNWGAGFFPGLMWDLYALTGDPYWLTKADIFTDGVEPLKNAGGDMQMNIGFHMMNSYARRLAWMPQAGDSEVVTAAAARLMESWMPAVGSFYSFTWDRDFRYDGLQGGWKRNENAIIDSAPNMEVLLYEAKRQSDALMWERALGHLNNLIRDHIRADGSTAQLASYDTSTGAFLGLRGHQGYSSESTWSRGQGWALHGFASAWRETRDPVFADAFHNLYLYYRDNAPEDGVPYWDFLAPLLTQEEMDFRYPDRNTWEIRFGRDSSAAALAASALLRASQLAETEELRSEYFSYGEAIIRTLSLPGYLAVDGDGLPAKESILGQGSYTFPGIEKGQIWGDFFYVEALRRYRDIVQPPTVFAEDPLAGRLENYAALKPHQWTVVMDDGDAALRLQGGLKDPSMAFPHYFKAQPDYVLGADDHGDFRAGFVFRADENLAVARTTDAVLVFDFIDTDNYQYVLLSTDPEWSGIYRVKDGSTGQYIRFRKAWSGQGYHKLEVVRKGPQIAVWVDGESWGLFQTSLLEGTGRVGFGGFASSLFLDDPLIRPLEAITPLTLWKEAHFADPDASEAANDADPDGDGLTNLHEYALGADPHASRRGERHLVIRSLSRTRWMVDYTANLALTDIAYQLLQSTDGGLTWEPTEEETIDVGNGFENRRAWNDWPEGAAVLYLLTVKAVD